jgi:hypothetical protein
VPDTLHLVVDRTGIFESEMYFGDMSLDAFAHRGTGDEPWPSFQKARDLVANGDLAGAREALQSIARMPGIESRFRVQAWNSFRVAGGKPPTSVEKEVLGVVVEVGMPKGQDVLAIYADQTAHYYNYAGGAVVWLRPDASLDREINSALAAAAALAPMIGPWMGARRPPPSAGLARLNILTPSGLLFGEAPMRDLDRDKHSHPLMRAATAVMAKLTKLPRR